jgi:hypothetical protein
MTEAQEHASWGSFEPAGSVAAAANASDTFWGAVSEPSKVLCVGLSLQCWLEEPGMRSADARLSYACFDSVRGRVVVWHGPLSSPPIRARATRVALMWASELSAAVTLALSSVFKTVNELHNPPPRWLPRSLEEAREGVEPADSLVLSDGRSSFVWLPLGTAPRGGTPVADPDATVEREGAESAVFRAHFRILWGPTGDVMVRRQRAQHRYVARRPFEASCSSGDVVSLLGEGQVPHWCYALNLTTLSRGLLPLAVFSEHGETEKKAEKGDPVEALSSPRSPGRDGAAPQGVLVKSSSRITLRKKSSAAAQTVSEGGKILSTQDKKTMTKEEKRRSRQLLTTPRVEEIASFPGIRMRVVDEGANPSPPVSSRSVARAATPSPSSTPVATARSTASDVEETGRATPEIDENGRGANRHIEEDEEREDEEREKANDEEEDSSEEVLVFE